MADYYYRDGTVLVCLLHVGIRKVVKDVNGLKAQLVSG